MDREKKIEEIIRRFDLRNDNGHNHDLDNLDVQILLDELERAHAEISRLKSGGWISVNERLPAVGETVLIYYRYHDQQSIVTARFVNGGFIGFWDADVTHWQPLPEPPKEGEKG